MRLVNKMLTRDGPWRPGRGNDRPPSEGQAEPEFRGSSSVAGRISLRRVPECDATVNLDEGGGHIKSSASVFKNIRITERLSAQFRAEFFKILSHPSFLVPVDQEAIFNQNGSIAPAASAIDATSTDSRQIQYGLKINW